MANRTKLGKSELQVHPIGVGTNAVGGHDLYPNLDEETGKALVREAINHDMNFLDTAYSYGKGRSEELVGEVVKASGKRNDIVLATKGGMTEDGSAANNSPSHLKQNVEDSLRRMQADYIDLFYIHFPDEDTPKAEAVGALKELKDEGRIRSIGVSNFSIDQLKDANKDGYVDVYQGQYNLIDRSAENELFPYTTENQISFIPYFPLASGLLAGKYDKNTTFSDFRKDMPHLKGDAFVKNLESVEKIREIANNKQADVAHIVLAWYLTKDAIDAVIPGAKRPDQVLNNLKTVDVQLTDDEIQAINQLQFYSE